MIGVAEVIGAGDKPSTPPFTFFFGLQTATHPHHATDTMPRARPAPDHWAIHPALSGSLFS